MPVSRGSIPDDFGVLEVLCTLFLLCILLHLDPKQIRLLPQLMGAASLIWCFNFSHCPFKFKGIVVICHSCQVCWSHANIEWRVFKPLSVIHLCMPWRSNWRFRGSFPMILLFQIDIVFPFPRVLDIWFLIEGIIFLTSFQTCVQGLTELLLVNKFVLAWFKYFVARDFFH